MSQGARDPRRFPFPPAITIIALLSSWCAGRIWPIVLSWPAWTIWVGWTLFLLSIAFAVAAVVTFRHRHTAVNPLGEVTTIVAEGPFKYTRNPMYVALVVNYIGGMLAFRLPWAAALFVPVVLALHFGVIRPEEQHLEAVFGESYVSYKRRVRRWL
jgi:protein-S-isoprenylcysteine O-methyltransferase Ste14